MRRGGNCPNTLEVLQQLLLLQPSSSPSTTAANSSTKQDTQQHNDDPHHRKKQEDGQVAQVILHVQPYLVSSLPDVNSTATSKIMSSFGGNDHSLIDFSHCLYRPGHDEAASSYIIRSQAKSGSRTIVNFNDLPEMTASEFEQVVDKFTGNSSIDSADCWFHFEVGKM